MKKAIALLLALVMMLALCGCGSSKELTQEEKEKIYEEIRQQKEQENKEETASANEFDVIVEDCAFAWETNDFVNIKPKVHNCTDMDAAFLLVNCELVDKDGRTIRVTSCETGGVSAGANEWVSGTIQLTKDEAAKIEKIVFSGGGFDISKDGKCYRQTVRFAETSFTKEHVFGE